MVTGYLIVDRHSGFVRAFRRDVVAAFTVEGENPGSVVMLVQIPADQEVLYRTAEAVRADRPAEPGGEFVRTVRVTRRGPREGS